MDPDETQPLGRPAVGSGEADLFHTSCDRMAWTVDFTDAVATWYREPSATVLLTHPGRVSTCSGRHRPSSPDPRRSCMCNGDGEQPYR